MQTVEEFIYHVGREDFAKATGHAQQVISRAITENVMPASWYLGVREFCASRSADVPEHLFRWSEKRKGTAA